MPGTGQASQVYSVDPGRHLYVDIDLSQGGVPYHEPVCITPILVESPDCYISFHVRRYTGGNANKNTWRLWVENLGKKTARFKVQFGWFT